MRPSTSQQPCALEKGSMNVKAMIATLKIAHLYPKSLQILELIL